MKRKAPSAGQALIHTMDVPTAYGLSVHPEESKDAI